MREFSGSIPSQFFNRILTNSAKLYWWIKIAILISCNQVRRTDGIVKRNFGKEILVFFFKFIYLSPLNQGVCSSLKMIHSDDNQPSVERTKSLIMLF